MHREPTNAAVALVSTFDSGLQPLAIASAAAYIQRAGIACDAFDVSRTPVSHDDLAHYRVVVFSVPGFESIQDAVGLAATLRASKKSDRPSVGFVGTYAGLNSTALLEQHGDWIIAGNFEESLVLTCERLLSGRSLDCIPGVSHRGGTTSAVRSLSQWLVPDRSVLPPISEYPYAPANKFFSRNVVTGNIETTRGCRFRCSYCSVFAAHHGKVSVIPSSVVLADIDQVVASGAQHICFADAEFLNAPRHSLAIVRKMHESYPSLTFDFTSRADLIGEDRQRLQSLVECGARWVTSAFEFPNGDVLQIFNKGFGVQQVEATVNVAREVGLRINPTFVLFNPWVSARDIQEAIAYIENLGLEPEDVQFRTRLWLYKGSPLLDDWTVQASITQEHPFHFEWRHQDPAVERMFTAMAEQYGGLSGRCCLKC